ncbi:hypothetical protein [Parapedobacter sp. 2B3]|uniref:hypothetical protein n=1 Tax=Parapedobacter sp. 2B3 TaxID=3342381 RepID=UPI0035B5AB2A
MEIIKTWTEIIYNIISALSFIAVGFWVIYRFVLQKERFPNLNFSAGINVIGKQNDFYIVELIAIVENRGKSQHKMEELKLDLDAVFVNDGVETSEEWGGQINFPNHLLTASYLPAGRGHFFVDPGTEAKYSYIFKVPIETNFLMLHSRFNYIGRKRSEHAAEKTIKIDHAKYSES